MLNRYGQTSYMASNKYGCFSVRLFYIFERNAKEATTGDVTMPELRTMASVLRLIQLNFIHGVLRWRCLLFDPPYETRKRRIDDEIPFTAFFFNNDVCHALSRCLGDRPRGSPRRFIRESRIYHTWSEIHG